MEIVLTLRYRVDHSLEIGIVWLFALCLLSGGMWVECACGCLSVREMPPVTGACCTWWQAIVQGTERESCEFGGFLGLGAWTVDILLRRVEKGWSV